MLEKKLSWVLIAATLAIASQSTAQPASPQDEAAVARDFRVRARAWLPPSASAPTSSVKYALEQSGRRA